jgi:hypothetical protein
MTEMVSEFGIEGCFDGKLCQHTGKLVEVSFRFKAFGQFSRKGLSFFSSILCLSPLLE